MDSKVIDMILENHRDLKCQVCTLNEKLDELLSWRAKLIGATIAVSGVLTIVFQLVLTQIK